MNSACTTSLSLGKIIYLITILTENNTMGGLILSADEDSVCMPVPLFQRSKVKNVSHFEFPKIYPLCIPVLGRRSNTPRDSR